MKHLILAALLVFSSRTVTAQGPGPQGLMQARNAPSVAPTHPAAARDTTVRPSEWKKGALIGMGIDIGLTIIVKLTIGNGICDSNCGFHLSFEQLGILGIFGIIGGLIGSTIHHD